MHEPSAPSRARLALCYGFLQGAWPFGLVEAIWASAAVYHRRQSESQAAKKRGPYKPRQPPGDFKLDLPVSLS